ncbi:MAG: ATP-binding protein [Actinomycetota bacterium]
MAKTEASNAIDAAAGTTTAGQATSDAGETRGSRAAEALLFSVLDSAPQAIVLVDADGRVAYLNKEAERLYGYGRKEVLGGLVEVLVPERFREAHPAHRTAYAADPSAGPMSGDIEAFGRRKDGTEFPAQVTVSPAMVGERLCLVALVRDMSENRRLEEAKREMQLELAEAYKKERGVAEHLREVNDMKDALMRSVSHDFRIPLTAVLGFAETLQKNGYRLSAEESSGMVNRIAANARRLRDLISDLMDLDRSSGGVLDLQRSPTDVGQLVERVVGDLGLPDGAVEIDVEPVVAEVDAGLVERIVENLVVNARHHTPPGTPVWARVRSDASGVLILVEDAGPGVPEEIKGMIFEPFRRGREGEVQAPGQGIGLSLVAEFAKLHGGRAWVEDRTGGGASFRVFLPKARARA